MPIYRNKSSQCNTTNDDSLRHVGGLLLDHGTGVVIGETSVVGQNCSFLHGITLGGTGKPGYDRHPKLGNNVFVGCQVTILGNITIGDYSSIGAGSLVLKSLPAGATAIGSPATIKSIRDISGTLFYGV